jgi:hypothetical protein
MHRTRRKSEDVTEVTTAEFRAKLLVSLHKLNSKDTLKTGSEELLSVVDQLSPQDESLSVYMVSYLILMNHMITFGHFYVRLSTTYLAIHTHRKSFHLLIFYLHRMHC